MRCHVETINGVSTPIPGCMGGAFTWPDMSGCTCKQPLQTSKLEKFNAQDFCKYLIENRYIKLTQDDIDCFLRGKL